MKLRIAVTRREYINDLDGVNRFVFTLADGLNSLGHDVTVLSYSFRDIPRSEISACLKDFFGFRGNVYTLTHEAETVNWSKMALTWFLTGSRLLNQLDLDAVIVNGIVPLRTKAVKIAVNHGILTGEYARAGSTRRYLYLQIARNLYKHYADISFCDSPQLQGEFSKLIKTDSITVPLPVKLSLFRSEPVRQRDSTVLHIGTRPDKNAELSIRAIDILTGRMNVDAKLVILGSKTPYIEELMSRYKHLIPRHLDFVGPRGLFSSDNETIQDLLAHARALVLPSKHEVLPYSVLEAFASGLPVVVSTAVPEEMVSDGSNGFRVSGFNPDLYAKRLASLLADDTLWQSVSRNALNTASDYSHIKIAKIYESVLRRLIS
jgi:glycosyltransferase involved in cell wall biosynthesis